MKRLKVFSQKLGGKMVVCFADGLQTNRVQSESPAISFAAYWANSTPARWSNDSNAKWSNSTASRWSNGGSYKWTNSTASRWSNGGNYKWTNSSSRWSNGGNYKWTNSSPASWSNNTSSGK